MKAGVRLILACGVGVLLLAAQPGRAAGIIRSEIERLLNDAMAAPTVPKAHEKLAAAKARLTSATIKDIEREFLNTEIERTRALAVLNAWRRAPDVGARHASPLRDEARRLLLAALDLYGDEERGFQKMAKDNLDKITESLPPDADPAKDSRAGEASDYVARTTYNQAWLEYRLGDLADPATEAADREARLKKALERFGTFTAEGYRDHPIILDCYLGKTLCLYGLKQYDEVLATLQEEDKPADNRKGLAFSRRLRDGLRSEAQRPAYKTLLHLFAKSHEAKNGDTPSEPLETMAFQYFDSLPTAYVHDKLDLDLALVRASNLNALAKAAAGNRTGMAATYQARLERIKSLIELYGEPWYTELYRRLGQPPPPTTRGVMEDVRKLFGEKKYQDARDGIDKALASLEKEGKAKGPVGADLRHARAAAYWNLQSWPDAHRAAYEFIKLYPQDRRAPEMCRRALQAGLKAVTARPPALETPAFLDFLDYGERNFKDEPEVQRAPWTRAHLLLEAKQYPEAEATLKRVDPKSPLYRQAQYGAALAAYRQAEPLLVPNPLAAKAHLERAAAAAGRAADTPPQAGTLELEKLPEALVSVAHAIAQSFLNLPQPKQDAVARLLDKLDQAPGLKEIDTIRRLALRLEAKALAGGTDEVIKMIDGVLQGDAPEPHLIQVIANFADRLEKEADRLDPAGRQAQAEEMRRKLAEIYRFMLRQVGQSTDARIRAQEPLIRRHLAGCLLALGEDREAADNYEKLKKNARPGEPLPADVLRGLARSYGNRGIYAKALENWRPLARGLQKESEDWYEAQYHVIRCVYKAGNRQNARQLMDLFRLQYPAIKSPVWAPKFKALDEEIGPMGTPGAGPQ